MKTRAELLAWKRQRLIAECIAQRSDFVMQVQPLTHGLDSLDTGLRIAGRVRQHPGWIAGALIALFAVRPRRISASLRAGAALLRTWRLIAPSLRLK